MSKKSSNKVNAPVVKAPEVKASGVGEYRANCAFAFQLERVERGATITLTAEQATALGAKVSLVAPVQSGENKEQGQSGASDEGAAGASTADDASGSEAANQDQTV